MALRFSLEVRRKRFVRAVVTRRMVNVGFPRVNIAAVRILLLFTVMTTRIMGDHLFRKVIA